MKDHTFPVLVTSLIVSAATITSPVIAQDKPAQRVLAATPFQYIGGKITAVNQETQTVTISTDLGHVEKENGGNAAAATFARDSTQTRVISLSPLVRLSGEDAELSANKLRVGDMVSEIVVKTPTGDKARLHFTSLENAAHVVSLSPLTLHIPKPIERSMFNGIWHDSSALTYSQTGDTSVITIVKPEEVRLSRTKPLQIEDLSIGQFILTRWDSNLPVQNNTTTNIPQAVTVLSPVTIW